MAKGKLATDEDKFIQIATSTGMPIERMKTVMEFYDQSLKSQLAGELNGKKAAVIYIDCDLYESTVPILAFIKDFLQIGSIIVFDDWNCFNVDPIRGERRAWAEFIKQNRKLRFTQFVQTSEANLFIFLGDQNDKERINGLYTSIS